MRFFPLLASILWSIDVPRRGMYSDGVTHGAEVEYRGVFGRGLHYEAAMADLIRNLEAQRVPWP